MSEGTRRSMTLPQIGETWTHRLNQVDGIVAKVAKISGTIVTFVSLTGNRVTMQFDRSGSPWSSQVTYGPSSGAKPDWVFKASAPEWFQSCSRERCTGPAFIRYTRPTNDLVELVC